ncbi:MAG: hypothetical protein LBR90_01255 [Elusimicrobiota bacterium]|jgi:hypothetical protein|nr:hypothetical protein [Elusimicrobiota bacterium]
MYNNDGRDTFNENLPRQQSVAGGRVAKYFDIVWVGVFGTYILISLIMMLFVKAHSDSLAKAAEVQNALFLEEYTRTVMAEDTRARATTHQFTQESRMAGTDYLRQAAAGETQLQLGAAQPAQEQQPQGQQLDYAAQVEAYRKQVAAQEAADRAKREQARKQEEQRKAQQRAAQQQQQAQQQSRPQLQTSSGGRPQSAGFKPKDVGVGAQPGGQNRLETRKVLNN